MHQEVDPCAAGAVAEEVHQEEEVDSAETAVVAASEEAVAHLEVEDLEHAAVEADSAEVRLEEVDSVLDVAVSAVAEEVELSLVHHRTVSSWRLGVGNGVVGILVSTSTAGWTIPSVYEKGYVVSKLAGDDCMLIQVAPFSAYICGLHIAYR